MGISPTATSPMPHRGAISPPSRVLAFGSGATRRISTPEVPAARSAGDGLGVQRGDDSAVVEAPTLGHGERVAMARAQVVRHGMRLRRQTVQPRGAAGVVVAEGGGRRLVAARPGTGAR